MQPSCPTILPESGAFVLGGSGKFDVLLTQREKTPGHHWVISRGYRGLVPESSSPGWLVTAEKQNPLQRAPHPEQGTGGGGDGPFSIFTKEGLGRSQVGRDRDAERSRWSDTSCKFEKI